MKKLLISLFLIFIVGCTAQSAVIKEISINSLTLATDKELYHSNENMNVSVTADISDACNATLRVYGINSRYNRLDKTQIVKLSKGLNTLSVDYTTPRCNTCSGIKAGTYDITAELKIENTTSNASKKVDIQQ